MSHRALIACALVAVASPAGAETWDSTYAFGGHGQMIGGEGYRGLLMQIQLGRRITQRFAVSVSAELAHAFDGDDVAVEGAIVRGLAGVDIYVLKTDGALAAALVASAGSGSETIMWDRGTLTRPLSYLALEFRESFRIDESGFFRNISSIGFRFGVRGQVAPGVADTTVAKLCSACEPMATPDRGVDLGFAIYMGLIFGR